MVGVLDLNGKEVPMTNSVADTVKARIRESDEAEFLEEFTGEDGRTIVAVEADIPDVPVSLTADLDLHTEVYTQLEDGGLDCYLVACATSH